MLQFIVFTIFAVAFFRFAHLIWRELKENYEKRGFGFGDFMSGAFSSLAYLLVGVLFVFTAFGKTTSFVLRDYVLEWNIFDILFAIFGLFVAYIILFQCGKRK